MLSLVFKKLGEAGFFGGKFAEMMSNDDSVKKTITPEFRGDQHVIEFSVLEDDHFFKSVTLDDIKGGFKATNAVGQEFYGYRQNNAQDSRMEWFYPKKTGESIFKTETRVGSGLNKILNAAYDQVFTSCELGGWYCSDDYLEQLREVQENNHLKQNTPSPVLEKVPVL